jgi:hypothetical protein
MSKKPTPASQADTDRIEKANAVDSTASVDDSALDAALAEIAALTARIDALEADHGDTKRDLRRIGECPGLKIY